MSIPAQNLVAGEEYEPEGEARLVERVVNISAALLRSTHSSNSSAPVPRGQHPKSHGCVRTEFTVGADIPPELRHGIFSEPRVLPGAGPILQWPGPGRPRR